MPYRIYSFDVFDTTLTRCVSGFADVFVLMQEYLERSFPGIHIPSFAESRKRSETEARQNSEREDIRLVDIYRRMQTVHGLSDDDVTSLMDLELDTEYSLVSPIASTITRIERLRGEGKRVIFVSNMYLPSEHIKKILIKAGAYKEGDGIYVSGDIGSSKKTGSLFRYIAEKEGCDVKDICHYGDNAVSDIYAAICSGAGLYNADIKTVEALKRSVYLTGIPERAKNAIRRYFVKKLYGRILFHRPGKTRYEKHILRAFKGKKTTASLLAGVARAVRLSFDGDEKETVIWNTSADVIAPVFFMYTVWVLEKAKREGVKRLYFVARDGNIFLEIARILTEKWDYDIELRYLYGSRQAWYFPSMSDIGKFELEWVIRPDRNTCTVKTIFSRLPCDMHDFADSLEKYGFPESSWDRKLSGKDIRRFTGFLMDNDIKDRLVGISQGFFESAYGYLKQEGFSDRVNYALVNIGWSGRFQYALSKILSRADAYPEGGLKGYYLGLYRLKHHFRDDDLDSYLFKGVMSLSQCNINNVMLFEVFSAAPHGRTTNYAFKDGKYVPVFDDVETDISVKWGLNTQRKSILRFADMLSSLTAAEDIRPDAQHKINVGLLSRFIQFPGRDEAAVYGDYAMTDEPIEGEIRKIAPAVTYAHIYRCIKNGIPLRSFWPVGSLVRSGMKFLRAVWKVRQLVNIAKGRILLFYDNNFFNKRRGGAE